MKVYRQFLIFAIAGTAGFVADVGALYLALEISLGYFIGRLLSFLLAVTVTWIINRRFTFETPTNRSLGRQWLKYLAAMSVGGVVNYAAYSVVVIKFSHLAFLPVLAVMAGTFAGMLLNFSTAKWWVFKA